MKQTATASRWAVIDGLRVKIVNRQTKKFEHLVLFRATGTTT